MCNIHKTFYALGKKAISYYRSASQFLSKEDPLNIEDIGDVAGLPVKVKYKNNNFVMIECLVVAINSNHCVVIENPDLTRRLNDENITDKNDLLQKIKPFVEEIKRQLNI